MRGFLIKWFVNTVALIAVIHIIPGIHVDRLETAAIASLILGLVNAFLRPFLVLLTLPVNILSFGLLTLMINGFMLYMVSWMVRGFTIAGFWNAFWGALFFSITSSLLNLFVNPQGKVKFSFYGYRQPKRPKYTDVIDVEGKAGDKEE